MSTIVTPPTRRVLAVMSIGNPIMLEDFILAAEYDVLFNQPHISANRGAAVEKSRDRILPYQWF